MHWTNSASFFQVELMWHTNVWSSWEQQLSYCHTYSCHRNAAWQAEWVQVKGFQRFRLVFLGDVTDWVFLPAGKEMIELYFDFRLYRLWKTRQHSKLLDYEDFLWHPCREEDDHRPVVQSSSRPGPNSNCLTCFRPAGGAGSHAAAPRSRGDAGQEVADRKCAETAGPRPQPPSPPFPRPPQTCRKEHGVVM